MGRRPRGEIDKIRASLRVMVSDEFRRAGQRFVSARYISQRFKVSYQTAHRLLTELEGDGFIIRRAGSGSFIAGHQNTLQSALLIFARRAKRSGSFGDLLLRQLVAKMKAMEIPFEVIFGGITPKHVREDVYPVLWESPRLMHNLSADYRFSLVLHDKPPAGIGSLFTDSISVDDFSGGITAGQILSRYSPRRPVVIGGPAADARSQSRIDGFRQIFPSAQVIEAGTWFFRSAVQNIAAPLSSLRADALFCCSDRLAQATLICYQKLKIPAPIVIGFDNAPVAETLSLSTIGIPWEEVARAAAAVIMKRLGGQTDHASAVVLPPVPVIRNSR
ncbi:MAG TPA: substrate-binding domain-containing protein [Chthoniobacterales bacterium]|nr:substrate-binding domain-containing protein [Chthoniobacterales bacterium]